MPVNIVAPYILTALLPLPQRLIYLSSSSHFGGQTIPRRGRLGGPKRRFVLRQPTVRRDSRYRHRPTAPRRTEQQSRHNLDRRTTYAATSYLAAEGDAP